MKRILWMILILFFVQLPVLNTEAAEGTVYESPYVSFSPDGRAWTFGELLPPSNGAGRPEYWYYEGETISTGIPSGLENLQPGQHYYNVARTGDVPVGKWVVRWSHSQCIHSDAKREFHNISYGKQWCLSGYYSGWIAYCADCNQAVSNRLIYGSKRAVASVRYIDTGLDHYYLCPTCNHLEQGCDLKHYCYAVSYNRYRVSYDGNGEFMGKRVNGFVPESFHMYNNETLFEGNAVVPSTCLNLNSFEMTGYTFTGWNTKPDGSGSAFEDGAEILNLCSENYDGSGDRGEIVLYAQWVVTVSELEIDPNGGSYCGSNEKKNIRKPYGSDYMLENDSLVPPPGYLVSFECNGGNLIPPIRNQFSFVRWNLLQPCGGTYREGQYRFGGKMNHKDVIRAIYHEEPVVLPTPEREGFSFGGWFSDLERTRFVGMGGDAYVPDQNRILYAEWTELNIVTEDVYFRDVDLQDWRTAGSIYYGVKKESGMGDNSYRLPSDPTAVFQATGAVDVKISSTGISGNYYRLWMSKEQNTETLREVYDRMKSEKQSSAIKQEIWYEMADSTKGVIPENRDDYSAIYTVDTGGTEAQYYHVCADGLYTLRAAGGKGGDYRENEGGCAGEVVLTLYLRKGEFLTIMPGKRGLGVNQTRTPGGYEGGASGKYGAAGGSGTRVLLTDVNGITTELLVAAGGGGASSIKNGYAASDGYADPDTIQEYEDNLSGYGLVKDIVYSDGDRQGGGGGGGGCYNGVAGNVILHSHTARPSWSGSYDNQSANVTNMCAGWKWTSGGVHYGHVTGASCHHYWHWGIVNGVCAQGCRQDDDSWHYQLSCSICGKKNSPHIQETYTYTCNDCGAYLGESSTHTHPSSWSLRCTKKEGESVDGADPSYGGLSYINTMDSHCVGNIEYDNRHKGDGYVSVEAVTVGYTESGLITAIPARDVEKPDAISNITFESFEGTAVVRWDEPAGNATTYYFFGESYYRDGPELKKNLTTNLLAQRVDSALAGYYYICDGKGEVSADYLRNIVRKETESVNDEDWNSRDNYVYEDKNAAFLSEALGFTKDNRLDANDVGNDGNRAYRPDSAYVHIAAVDVAGNVADTVTVSLEKAGVPWSLKTTPLSISSTISGIDYQSIRDTDREKTWYVKADGKTPFLLTYHSHMIGKAREDYQINHQLLEIQAVTGDRQRYSVMLPYTVPLTQNGELDSSQFLKKAVGENILSEGNWISVSRNNGAGDVSFQGAFVLSGEMHGKEILITPMAGADFGGKTIFSEWSEDCKNALTVIADGRGPVISGMERLEELMVIDRTEGQIWLEISAADELSGVAEFYLEVKNQDNFVQQRFDSENNEIRIEITEDLPLFTGDVTVIGYARDNVGNVTEMSYQLTEFALETGIERLLEPHEPVFKNGESGVLSIVTYGYADRVEIIFPEEMTSLNPALNQVIDYSDMQCYRQVSEIQFMIPLYTSENTSYEVTVRAYKGDRKLEEHPVISTMAVSGSVLDELRTRLR